MIRSLSLTSSGRTFGRLASLGALLMLVACGGQNWPVAAPSGTLGLAQSTAAVGQQAGTVTLSVTRTGGNAGKATVHFATSDGSALNGTDYTGQNATLTWNDGDAVSQNISIPISGTTPFYGTKTFTLTLSNATGATLGSLTTATVTITGSAPPPPAGNLSFSAATTTVSQTATSVTLTVNRTNGNGGAISVQYATSNGTAIAGTDFTASSGQLSWADGDATPKTLTVALATQAAFVGSKSFTVVLSNPQGTAPPTLQSPSTATVTLLGSNVTLRPLPAVYTSGKAVNYSAYRAGGPNVGEVPTDAQILQDLTLLHSGGFNLLRLFGADITAANILRIAQANFPGVFSFQLGIYLTGATSACVDGSGVNNAQITTAIQLAHQYSNEVATVSVGNETSFANNLPVQCLASYITQVRSQVSQPITADDDYTFYAGLTGSGERPDTILPLIDFVSLHDYPFATFYLWDWQQLSVPAGPARAQAMMEASLAQAKTAFNRVASYSYINAQNQSVTIGATLPLVIGETGWKVRVTNSSNPLEVTAASPVNAKWYYDLLNSWTGVGAPTTIFYFEAFDELWKAQYNDAGWGLWDANRNPLYALCGTSAGAACTNPVYAGALYHP